MIKNLQRLEPECRVLRIPATWDGLPVPPGAETHVSISLLLSREIFLPALGFRSWGINNSFHLCKILTSFQISLSLPPKTKEVPKGQNCSKSMLPTRPLSSLLPLHTSSPALGRGRVMLMTKGRAQGSAADQFLPVLVTLFWLIPWTLLYHLLAHWLMSVTLTWKS